MRTLNLGILAHVDAGKTTLTERLLYAAGVIDEMGSVDDGTTQMDSLALEQQRGITIKSAVASFAVSDVTVNLIDTPGHPDFIAEVERALHVLDGAVLVLSAVEGVQPQTRILFRALRRLGVPTVLFVNKIDRPGADEKRVLHAIRARLTSEAVPVGTTRAAGTRRADFVSDEGVLREPQLAVRTRELDAHPTFFGSALTGAGVAALTGGAVQLLTPPTPTLDGPVAGRVFKVERGRKGDKVAYVRVFTGMLSTRDRVRVGTAEAAKVTGIEVFADGKSRPARSLVAGQIGRVRGLAAARVGEAVGEGPAPGGSASFAPPTMHAVVVPEQSTDRGRLRVALGELAEHDPLIDVHLDGDQGELVLSLYGEVQKQVVEATLKGDYGLDVAFQETTTVCVERPAGPAEVVEFLWSESHPYSATVGLRVEPAPAGSGFAFTVVADPRTVPLHIYKTHQQFADHMRSYISECLEVGRYGWEVTDCAVAMTHCGFYVGDGRRKPVSPTPKTAPQDFRQVTHLVLRQALDQAGTITCEPMLHTSIETSTETLGAVMTLLAKLGADLQAPTPAADLVTISAVLPATALTIVSHQLPGLTGGEGALETTFAGYRPTTTPRTRTAARTPKRAAR